MCLISAFLQSHVRQAVEFLQGDEMNAALSAFLLDLYTLACREKISASFIFIFWRMACETHSDFGATGFQLLYFCHQFGQSGTRVLIQHVVLLRVPDLQLHLLVIHSDILRNTHTHWVTRQHTHTHTQPCLTAETRTQPNNNTFLWDEIWPSSPKGATENMTTAEQEIQNCICLWFNEIQNYLQQINQVVLIEAQLHSSLQYLIVIWQSQQIFL